MRRACLCSSIRRTYPAYARMQNGNRSSRFLLIAYVQLGSSKFLLAAPGHATHQTKASQQHRVGFWFWDRTNGGHTRNGYF